VTALDPRPHDWLRRALAVLGWGVVGAAAVTGGAMAAQLVATDDRLLVHEVRFNGNHQVSDPSLRHLADVRNGEHLFLVDLGRAVDGIERHPAIASASARRVFPGAVEIDVVEHEPKMLLALDELWFLDSNGQPYARAGSSAIDLPVITGIDRAFVDGDPEHARAVVWGARRVLGAAVTDAGIAESDVSEIHFDRLHGFELVLRSGTRLVVGYGNPSVPLQRVPALCNAGLDLRTPQLVDLDSERVAVATPLDSGRPMLGGTR
jgi:cell division protein FtsQ